MTLNNFDLDIKNQNKRWVALLYAWTVMLTTIDHEYIITLNSTFIPFESKKEGKDLELIQSSTTPDTGYQWESDNVTIRHHKREPRGQPFPSR